MKNLTSLLLALFAMIFPALMNAQEYPAYEGVYIWDNATSEWVEAPAQQPLRVQIASSANSPSESWNRFPKFNGWYQIPGYAFGIMGTVPHIDDEGGLRILIKSRDPALVFLNALTRVEILMSTIPPGPMVDSASISNDIGGSLSKQPESQMATFVGTGFGKSPEMFRSRIVDQYTTEYIGPSILGNWTVPGLGSCTGCDLPVNVLEVQTKTSRHLFLTVAIGKKNSGG